MTLSQLAAACGAGLRGAAREVTGVTHVAQDVRPGWVFAALPGQRRHGIEFVDQAVGNGAVAVLSDRDPGPAVSWLRAPNPRRATALAAWALTGHPERRLRMVGITGTNGKSTVADLVGRIATEAGERPGVFGTLAYTLPTRSERARRTTPEATDLAPLLAELADAGGTVAAMEVSSHALALERVAGLEFDIAVWTNLTRDHLDFHRDLDAYFATKASLERLLRRDPPGRRVIGLDDPFMARLASSPRDGDLTFGFGALCAVTALNLSPDFEGSSFRLRVPTWEAEVRLPLVGRHNARNALAAVATAVALGWTADAVVRGLATARPLPGRLEGVAAGTAFPVFVDYAHTPDGLEQVLLSLREVGDRRLVVVFGCGGDRDQGKRAPMGEIVGRLADVPIVTTDNPRSEDPQTIIAQVMDGVRASGNPRALAIADRREAIAAALSLADERCLVLVAGKGHETEQIFADRTVPFDDRSVVRELAQRRRA
ncbi:MAG TPA: UDP-N-acetylmuramoyl-L-alanyl-D-glutamate--2,6-diaminopimelate ligase [Thermoanaerobaculaceae bacterium]|nr:UDP-N-acetylmuramoyl-L-alanyl-D-glutamate--2,6-diaminopimelate ligase [Thermoanaerobaculaceae bacterium]